MGIPYYFSHIIKSRPDIIRKLIGANVLINNFFLDSNSIIYDVFHKMEKENQKHTSKKETENYIIQLVILKIESYINQVKPSKLVFIAFDGVAPM